MRRRAVVAVLAGLGSGTAIGAVSGAEDGAEGQLTPGAAEPVMEEAPYWARRGCPGWHRERVARRV